MVKNQMANIHSVPPKLHNEILNLLSEGYAVTKITTILNDKYSTNYSYDSVNRLVVKLRKQYQEVAKAKLVEGITQTATTDLHILDTVISSLFSKYQILMQEDNIDQAVKVASELNKWNSRRIELSGISKTDATEENDDAREELINNLCKMTQN